MKNLIVRWSELKGEIKSQVAAMLRENDPDMITFPYGGKTVQGFIYKTEDTSYLIIQNEANYSSTVSVSDDDDDDIDDVETDDVDVDVDADVDVDPIDIDEEE